MSGFGSTANTVPDASASTNQVARVRNKASLTRIDLTSCPLPTKVKVQAEAEMKAVKSSLNLNLDLSLLEKIGHKSQMYSMTLNCISDAWYMVQLLSPIDFEAGLVVRQDIPPKTGAHAGERVDG